MNALNKLEGSSIYVNGQAASVTYHDDRGEQRTILPHHAKQLASSGITIGSAKAAGIYSTTDKHHAATLLDWTNVPKKILPCLVFPYGNGYSRLRPDNPRKSKNKPIKYEAPRGQTNRPYLPLDVAQHLDNPRQELLITEGEKKALAATQFGFPCIGLSGVHAWGVKNQERLLPALDRMVWMGRTVYIVFDSDITRKPLVLDGERRLAKLLADKGASVRVVRLPDGPVGTDGEPAKIGLDDYLVAHGCGPLRKLLDEADEPAPVDAGSFKLDSNKADPAEEAGEFLERLKIDGACRLQFWGGSFWLWERGRYVEQLNALVRAFVVRHLNENFRGVGTKVVSDVMEQVRGQAVLPSSHSPPRWIGEAADEFAAWDAQDMLVAKNGVVHLPSFVGGQDQFLAPASPALFTLSALDYPFDPAAGECEQWFRFLRALWPDDPESVATLQEWFGYCLTPDTRQQKMLLLIGPKRSGKGTISRVLRSVVGEANVAGPTLASLATNFGLWPLLGKSLAIINDARLGGRTDQAAVVERMLSVSGEDALTVDRKNLVPLTAKLQARLMIVSNELPRLTDSSGAVAGRMLVLRMTESFYGQEDTGLTDKLLAERPGILLWAVQGWQRLRERGRFAPPTSSIELREQMEDLASPIGAFVRERCLLGPEHRANVDDLYRVWRQWCDAAGRESGNIQTFGRDLVAAVPAVRRVRTREGQERIRVYDGIRLR